MTRVHFPILYRQFLFRVIDLDLLSAQGDISKLLGQFASLLIFVGLLFTIGATGQGSTELPRTEMLVKAWPFEHVLIATTMLVVGLFGVLSWESTFPDRRDVLVLAPLPVRTRTLFLAKVAASASALGLTVIALNASTGLIWPLAMAPKSRNLLDFILSPEMYRSCAAYWITVLSAGAFIFGSVLIIQGLAAQILPRRQFLRVSAVLQMTAFGLLVTVYFLQPSLATPEALAAPQNQRYLNWLPSYWFLGLYNDLNGSTHPALGDLARRAWIALGITICGTAVVYTLSYFRTLRRIIEEPDIASGTKRFGWLPRFGNPLQTAVVQFSIRTLLRSRQHRVVCAFYLGIGFAISTLYLRSQLAQRHLMMASTVNVPLVASSIIMILLWVVGTRVVFSIPLDLRANWIFRVTPIRGGLECLAARRRAMFVLAIAPALLCFVVLFLSLWHLRQAIAHLTLIGLFGAILAELCLRGIQKFPFTCSYLPGKSHFHITFLLCATLLVPTINRVALVERRALEDASVYSVLVLALGITLFAIRWHNANYATSEQGGVQFEDVPDPAVIPLGLQRD